MSTSRRRLLKAAAAASIASVLPSSPFEERLQAQSPGAPAPAPAVDGYVLVTSANGVEAAKAARQALIQGYDPLDAAIAGVNINELDPNDMSVGYGGIPNEEGVVQLDACVMDGRTLRAGAVGALESPWSGPPPSSSAARPLRRSPTPRVSRRRPSPPGKRGKSGLSGSSAS